MRPGYSKGRQDSDRTRALRMSGLPNGLAIRLALACLTANTASCGELSISVTRFTRCTLGRLR